MFLIDDILLLPARGLLGVFREIHNAVEQEGAHRAETIRSQLSELYLMLESGRINDAEFDQQERELLDALDVAESGDSEEMAEPDSQDPAPEEST